MFSVLAVIVVSILLLIILQLFGKNERKSIYSEISGFLLIKPRRD